MKCASNVENFGGKIAAYEEPTMAITCMREIVEEFVEWDQNAVHQTPAQPKLDMLKESNHRVVGICTEKSVMATLHHNIATFRRSGCRLWKTRGLPSPVLPSENAFLTH